MTKINKMLIIIGPLPVAGAAFGHGSHSGAKLEAAAQDLAQELRQSFASEMQSIFDRKGEMPPWRYSILHRESKLSQYDRERIVRWIERTETKLK